MTCTNVKFNCVQRWLASLSLILPKFNLSGSFRKCFLLFRIRVGRSIEGFGLSPGITRQQRLDVESLMKNAFKKLQDDLAGNYFPLLGMSEDVRQKLVDDHFLFVSGDKNLIAAGMERDWPEGRGIYHNDAKTFLVWVNEEDQLRLISMQNGNSIYIFISKG